MKLREAIYEFFPKKCSQNYKLSDGLIEDDHGDTFNAFEESWVTWDQIENWQIARSAVVLSYAPRDVAAFLLPRFMVFTLDEIDGNLGEFSGLSASDSAIDFIEIIERRQYDYNGTNFTASQTETLKKFLEYVRNKQG